MLNNSVQEIYSNFSNVCTFLFDKVQNFDLDSQSKFYLNNTRILSDDRQKFAVLTYNLNLIIVFLPLFISLFFGQ